MSPPWFLRDVGARLSARGEGTACNATKCKTLDWPASLPITYLESVTCLSFRLAQARPSIRAAADRAAQGLREEACAGETNCHSIFSPNRRPELVRHAATRVRLARHRRGPAATTFLSCSLGPSHTRGCEKTCTTCCTTAVDGPTLKPLDPFRPHSLGFCLPQSLLC